MKIERISDDNKILFLFILYWAFLVLFPVILFINGKLSIDNFLYNIEMEKNMTNKERCLYYESNTYAKNLPAHCIKYFIN